MKGIDMNVAVFQFVSQEYKSWYCALLRPGTETALCQCKKILL